MPGTFSSFCCKESHHKVDDAWATWPAEDANVEREEKLHQEKTCQNQGEESSLSDRLIRNVMPRRNQSMGTAKRCNRILDDVVACAVAGAADSVIEEIA
jgi:hypothetical protein